MTLPPYAQALGLIVEPGEDAPVYLMPFEHRVIGRPGFLHGGVDSKGRSELTERFQGGKSRILISTDAGGTGLNLQAASLVVNFDLPFNPAKLAQRVARAHRMGQSGSVVVINLLCRNTVEEKLVKMLKDKQGLFDEVFGDISDPSQAKPSAQLSLRELLKELV